MSRLTIELGGKSFIADTSRATSLAIPLDPSGAQPHAFAAPTATATPLEAGPFVGSVVRGGSCNVGKYTLVTHCNGTHTECVGHVTAELVSVSDTLRETLFAATLVSLTPERAPAEIDPEVASPDDLVISSIALRKALVSDTAMQRAVVIRTLPNDPTKRYRDWDTGGPVPYLTGAAAALLVEIGCEHVILDLPSADRMADGGKLTAHRVFFGLPPGSTSAAAATRAQATITELAFIPDTLVDSTYLLDLQIPALVADAAPSRPLLLPLSPL